MGRITEFRNYGSLVISFSGLHILAAMDHMLRSPTLPLVVVLLPVAMCYCQDSPRITAIVSSADFQTPNPGIAPMVLRSLVTIFGDGLASTTASVTSPPAPTLLGGTRVMLCGDALFIERCKPLDLLYVSPKQINLVVSSNGQTAGLSGERVFIERDGRPSTSPEALASSARASTLTYAYQPRIFELGYDCAFNPLWGDTSPCGIFRTRFGDKQSLRGAITDQAGSIVSSLNPARVGSYYTIWLTGLGPLVNGRIQIIPRLTLAGFPQANNNQCFSCPAPISYAGPSSQFPGLDQINFLVSETILGDPSIFDGAQLRPCGEYRLDLSLTVSGSNAVDFPLLIRNGDVPCR